MYLKHDKIRLHRCETQTFIKWLGKMLTVYSERRIVQTAYIYKNHESVFGYWYLLKPSLIFWAWEKMFQFVSVLRVIYADSLWIEKTKGVVCF